MLDSKTLNNLQNMLHNMNPDAKVFQQAGEFFQENENISAEIVLKSKPIICCLTCFQHNY
jgi:hypothetical protein